MSSFPTLLRSSKFASHDPLVTRIYTTSKSSISRASDWGLKYPISRIRNKGPRYIKIHGLDAGRAIGTDWSSAEKEARFVETWGTGKVSWVNEAQRRQAETISLSDMNTLDVGKMLDDAVDANPSAPSASTSSSSSSSSSTSAPAAESGPSTTPSRPPGVGWVKDLESLTPREFELYLEDIRAKRAEWRESKIAAVSDINGPQRRSRIFTPLTLPEDRTLVNMAARGRMSVTEGAEIQVAVEDEALAKVDASRIRSSPHHLWGLSYSAGPNQPTQPHGSGGSPYGGFGRRGSSNTPGGADPEGSYVPREFLMPGRAMDQQSNQSESRFGNDSFQRARETGFKWVVSAGGVAGTAPGSQSVNADSVLNRVDYTRENRTAGEATFRVHTAKIAAPPRVLDLADSRAAEKWGERTISMAVRPKPFDTMKFDIGFVPVQRGYSPLSAASPSAPGASAGSAGWVGQEVQSGRSSREDDLGRRRRGGLPYSAGAPRSERSSYLAYKDLRAQNADLKVAMQRQQLRQSAEEANRGNISRVLERLSKNAPAETPSE